MARPPAPELTRRQLNRALLARQGLLARADRPVADEVARLVSVHGQEPPDPYVGLWARLHPFTPSDLGDLLEARALVRLVSWRGTIHLHTAADAPMARALAQEVVDRRIAPGNAFGRSTVGLDLPAVLADVYGWMGTEPRTGAEVRARLAPLGSPDLDRLVDVVKYALPVVQVPPRGVWGRSGAARWAPLDQWLGTPLVTATPADGDDLVLRYLAAHGPATAADIASWSGWAGVRARLDRVRDRLVTFRHEDTGREMVDLPDGIRPDPDTPAPVRLLPDLDDALYAHADRSRIAPPGCDAADRMRLDPRPAVVLVDGTVGGLWKVHRDGGGARVVLRPLRSWSRAQVAEAESEAAGLLAWQAPGLDHDVEVTAPLPARL